MVLLYRSNLKISSTEMFCLPAGIVEQTAGDLESLSAVKDSLVIHEDIADDSLGDEEWSAISANT